MTQAFKPNIFNIPSNYHFFDSLTDWLNIGFGSKINDVKILFPNRRACREFQNIFIDKFGPEALMPKVKAIGDISYDDFLDSFPRQQINSIVDELFKIKHLDGFDYLFFLSNEIIKTKVFGENISFSQALSIATQLKNLFDDIERQEIDLSLLYEIDDSDLAAHRQFTLDFLKKFYLRVRNSVLKNNILSHVGYQNFVINKLAESIDSQGLKSPLVIAGSTGSVNYSKRLIKAVAGDKNGFVMLYGLRLEEFGLASEVADETHPQSILRELLKSMNVGVSDVKEITIEKFKICDESRLDFLSFLMLPSAETNQWQGLATKIELPKITSDFEKNFSYLEVQNEAEEARSVAIIASKASLDNKKIAIISGDKKFVELLKVELKKSSLEFNDARSLDLSSSKLANLILLLLELRDNNFESASLLAFLKHSYSSYLGDKNVLDFEIKILREQRSQAGLDGIKIKLESQKEAQKMRDKKLGLQKSESHNAELQNFFIGFLQDISGFINIEGELDLSTYILALIKAVENFTKKSFVDLIALEGASEELLQLFEKLKSAQDFTINTRDSLLFFQHLFAQISYFEKSDAIALIQILSPIEARLLNFDLMILASLNYGNFPQIESENWLGRKIRSDLGIDLVSKKVGQNAYDFCNYLSNESVILSRSKTKNGVPAIASPFVLRFEILCKKFAIEVSPAALLNGDGAFKIKVPQAILAPNPPRQFRPKKLAITDISKLLSNPYQIYARKILQLQELNKIDYEPEYKEFGSFVHKALEEFVKNPQQQDNFIKKAQEIFAQYFISEESKLIWWPKFENIFKNFIDDNNVVEACKNYVEVPVKIIIKDILLTGKIDRVSFFENGEVEIFDYKTGQIPASREVNSGAQPQLAISALMLSLGVIENCDIKNISKQKIRALNYWKLSSFSESEIKSMSKNNEDVAIMIAAAKAGLERLFDYFDDEKNGYFVAFDSRNEYSHLARIF
ncbi:MAG: hypothetical protein EXR06_01525 [Rickettsiales bacterium]|nr:hypothetical protein [Rickettsiales bacterium]